jgi:hypothetical protein
MLAEAKVGWIQQADGSVNPGRISRLGAFVKGDGQGRYYENTARSNIFSVTLPVTTGSIAAGNVYLAAAAASTQFAVWNPIGSGKNLSLLKFTIFTVAGTSPAGPVMHSMATTVPSISSSLYTGSIQNNNLGGGNSVARAMVNQGGSALTGSANALTYIRMADFWMTAGSVAVLNGLKMVEYIDGDIVVAPGTMWVPTWPSSTAVTWGGSLTWEEINI